VNVLLTVVPPAVVPKLTDPPSTTVVPFCVTVIAGGVTVPLTVMSNGLSFGSLLGMLTAAVKLPDVPEFSRTLNVTDAPGATCWLAVKLVTKTNGASPVNVAGCRVSVDVPLLVIVNVFVGENPRGVVPKLYEPPSASGVVP